MQVLRSAEESSTGFSKEDSIHQAFVKSIETAEHFIYIEVSVSVVSCVVCVHIARLCIYIKMQSQFFVSSVKQDERFKGALCL